MKKIILICLISILDIIILLFLIYLGFNYVTRAILTNVYYLPVNSNNMEIINENLKFNSSEFNNENIYCYGIIFKQSFPNGYDIELVISANNGLINIKECGIVDNLPFGCKNISGTIIGVFFILICIEILGIHYIAKDKENLDKNTIKSYE